MPYVLVLVLTDNANNCTGIRQGALVWFCIHPVKCIFTAGNRDLNSKSNALHDEKIYEKQAKLPDSMERG